MGLRMATQMALDKFGKQPLRVVEIGVREGKNAIEMLKNLNIKMLYLVDSYEVYQDGLKYKATEYYQDIWYKNMFYYMEDYQDKTTLVTKPSMFAVTLFGDTSLDYVYIDANHSFDHVKADIEAWSVKIKQGGIMGGHDYGNPDYPGVEEAVKQFCRQTKRELVVNSSKNETYEVDKLDWAVII